MFYIVETPESLDKLKDFKNEKVYCEVVPSSPYYHPLFTKVLALYLHPVSSNQGYIIPISHSDGLGMSYRSVVDLLDTFSEIFVLDKKRFLYYFRINNLLDIQLLQILSGKSITTLPDYSKNYQWFLSRYRNNRNVNNIVPLPILFENCEKNFYAIKNNLNIEKPDGFDFFNDTSVKVFHLIEQEGLRVIEKPFIENFKPGTPEFNIQENIVYTNYNLYNITSRPTNSFNNINFSAIPHKEEFRKCIIPKNDIFVELDFDGYHLRLLFDQLNYKLTEEGAHKQLAKEYLGKEEITQEEYNQAKQINFQAIYGRIPEKYKHINSFQLIQKYIDSLWSEFISKGYVNSPISNRRFYNSLDDMNPQKLMNYVMQNLETSRNIIILKNALNFLKNKKSKICLYTYDSLLVDFSKQDGKETLTELENILSEKGKFPIHYKFNKDLFFQN